MLIPILKVHKVLCGCPAWNYIRWNDRFWIRAMRSIQHNYSTLLLTFASD